MSIFMPVFSNNSAGSAIPVATLILEKIKGRKILEIVYWLDAVVIFCWFLNYSYTTEKKEHYLQHAQILIMMSMLGSMHVEMNFNNI